jgi:chorismate dehydratase
VTDETSTSVEILRLLLAAKYAVTPQAWVDAASPSDAVLLIGDQALRALHGGHPAPHRIDVGTEWVEWTGLPCVFARWGVRASLGATAAAELADALEASISDALASLRRIAMVRRDVGLDETGVQRYLRGFRYRLGPDEERAITELRRRLEPRP